MWLETFLLKPEQQLQRTQFVPYPPLPAWKELRLKPFSNITTNDVDNSLGFFHLGSFSLFIGNLFPWGNLGMGEWGTMHCLLKQIFLKGVGLKGRKCGLDLSFFWNFFLFFCLILPTPQIQNKNPNNQKSPNWLFTTHVFKIFGMLWKARGSLKITVLCILSLPSLAGLFSSKNMQLLSQLF